MYLYSFQGRYGHDKVCRTEQKGLSIGDLLVGKSDMFLVLGESTAWKIDKTKFQLHEELAVHYGGFFTKKVMDLIHRMVHEYFTSYKNVVKLFVTGELADLFKKESSTKKKVAQKLVVYPDVRTMDNLTKTVDISDKGVIILNGTSTQVQKDKAWWGLKMGTIHTLLCTYSQIFQDRKNLTDITLIDSHQRYYKNQQDPRYDTREIVRKMAEIHEAVLHMEGIDIFSQKIA